MDSFVISVLLNSRAVNFGNSVVDKICLWCFSTVVSAAAVAKVFLSESLGPSRSHDEYGNKPMVCFVSICNDLLWRTPEFII